jgi:putative MATE family efflux protein
MKNNDLITKPIPGLIKQIAIPSTVGFFFYTMFNIVDTYFGGLISTEALAALGLSFTLFFIITALGNGFSTGTTALIGAALGAEDDEQASHYAIQALGYSVLLGLFLTLVGTWLSPIAFSSLGAQGEYLEICLAYMDRIFLGAPLFTLNYMFNAMLNAQGLTKPFRNFLIAGSVLNVGLDYWFIFGGLGLPAMGVAGIAWATVLVQAMGVVYLGHTARKTGILKGFCLAGLLPRMKTYAEISKQGFPASVNMLTVGLGIYVINYFIALYGPAGVAAYSAAIRIEQIVLMPSIGLNTANLTIVAQNYGARKFERIPESVRKTLYYGAWMMIPGGVLVFFLAPWAMTIFSNDPLVIEQGGDYLRIAAFMLYSYVILYTNVSALQGLKRPFFALYMGLARQIAAPVIVFYFFCIVLDMGVWGVWWGIALVTWAAALFAWFYARPHDQPGHGPGSLFE